MVSRGAVWRGAVWSGEAWRGKARSGLAWQGKIQGWSRRGDVGCGMVGRCEAGQGREDSEFRKEQS